MCDFVQGGIGEAFTRGLVIWGRKRPHQKINDLSYLYVEGDKPGDGGEGREWASYESQTLQLPRDKSKGEKEREGVRAE